MRCNWCGSYRIKNNICEYCGRKIKNATKNKKLEIIKSDMWRYNELYNTKLIWDMNRIKYAENCEIIWDMNRIKKHKNTLVKWDMNRF